MDSFYFLIVLKEFDRIPSLLVFCDGFRKDILHFSDSCFHFFGEDFFWKITLLFFAALIASSISLSRPSPFSADVSTIGQSSSMERRLTSILIPLFSRRSAMFSAITTGTPVSIKLSGQIQVTLDICCIDKVDDHIWILFEDIVTADYLFQSVW